MKDINELLQALEDIYDLTKEYFRTDYSTIVERIQNIALENIGDD